MDSICFQIQAIPGTSTSESVCSVHAGLPNNTSSRRSRAGLLLLLATDGRELELLVNYGSDYENVRIRKGYSFMSQEEQARIKEHLSHSRATTHVFVYREPRVDPRRCSLLWETRRSVFHADQDCYDQLAIRVL
jgi:hypothetical protein